MPHQGRRDPLQERQRQHSGLSGHVRPTDKQAVQVLEAAAAHLRGVPGATAKVGAIGFCSGGRHTLLFPCSSNNRHAAIDCWGGFIHRATPDAATTAARPTPILDLVKNLHCALFAVFGEEDQNPPVEMEATFWGMRPPCSITRQSPRDGCLMPA